MRSRAAVSFLIITLRAGDLRGEGSLMGRCCGMGISHEPSPDELRCHLKTTLSFLIASRFLFFKTTVQLPSHN